MYSNNSSFVSIKQSVYDISVGELVELYKHDTDLLKYILIAKSEEDKRKVAEETRRREEAILQSKYIDLQLEQPIDDNTSLGFSSSEWLPYELSSPYSLFDVPFANLNLSAPSSPEPKTDQKVTCKRTFSRTRSTRKPSIKTLNKKNRSTKEDIEDEVKKTPSHNKVIEALRAKLQRSTQQPKPDKNQPVAMSPSGILLLDLKNPKRIFPMHQARNSFLSKNK